MPAYLVQVDPEVGGQYLLGGHDSHIVFAADAAGARAAAKARFGGDNDTLWGDSNVVDVTEVAVGADLEDWKFELDIYDVDARTPVESISVTGAASATPDSIAALAVTALNATDSIAGAAYDATGNVLTVAETTDGIGDHTVVQRWIPPWGESSFSAFEGSITDGGSAGAALTVAMPADGVVIPAYTAGLRRR